MTDKRYRVAQWGTGHTGRQSLKDVINHARYDLAGVYVYSPDNEGKDAGELAGTHNTGVIATRDIDALLATKPDCVLYMPLMDHHSIDDMCRILESGANIVTSATYFHHPASLDADTRNRLESACERGQTSLYDTGGGPGFIGEILPLAATMMERRLDSYTIIQFADVSQRNSPDFLRDWFGMDPATVDVNRGLEHLAVTDGASLRQTADAFGTPLDELRTSATVATATNTVELGTITVEAGTVGAWKLEVTGLRDGKPYLSFSRTMYVTKDLDPDWRVGDTGWRVAVNGDAPMYIDIKFPEPSVYHPISAGYNSHCPVNSVAAVCDAEPGLRVTADLRLVPNFAAPAR